MDYAEFLLWMDRNCMDAVGARSLEVLKGLMMKVRSETAITIVITYRKHQALPTLILSASECHTLRGVVVFWPAARQGGRGHRRHPQGE